jgi:hypothetical protein
LQKIFISENVIINYLQLLSVQKLYCKCLIEEGGGRGEEEAEEGGGRGEGEGEAE